ncbi:uncharacterized protein N7484_002271 [Penicillium longicatenatum]|uniref:uncharacterized protein n=1 Tax=Penicillium longicatenatum TaxID=1561947 RepID=UPI002547CF52|nr:uncharacterized protein N7484_002271 [Penicillium longicatenatum]KAJ5658622.1 hypothetical protein N7484_002271 [Penicillium longicatenatum]
MNQFPTPFSPIQITRPTSETSSPPSSRTTSPPSSPNSTFRRARTTSNLTPHHLFNLSFQPHQSTQSQDQHQNVSTDHHAVSILPCAVLRGRSSLMVVRRRPSAVDMALSEERSRCDGDAIERKGLDLMEPRPVEMEMEREKMTMTVNMGTGMTMGIGMGANAAGNGNSTMGDRRGSILRPQQSPRFVMGGIFEVMEGLA